MFFLFAAFSDSMQTETAGFLEGIYAGLVVVVVLVITKISEHTDSISVADHAWQFFAAYLGLPAIIGLVVFFLLARSFSEPALRGSISALFGVYTFVFGAFFYYNINTPDMHAALLLLLTCAAALFLFRSLFRRLAAALGSLIGYGLSLLFFILFLAAGALAYGLWYFNASFFVYGTIIAVLILAAAVFQIFDSYISS